MVLHIKHIDKRCSCENINCFLDIFLDNLYKYVRNCIDNKDMQTVFIIYGFSFFKNKSFFFLIIAWLKQFLHNTSRFHLFIVLY